MALLQTVQVAVSGATFHFDKLYTYLLPPRLEGAVFVGSMVLVPFGRGNKPRTGVVLALGEQEEAGRCKELFDAAPEEARLTDELLGLVHFLKERTFCTWYEAVRAIIPYGAQYRPASTENGPRLQKQLQRHTEPLYELAGPLPEKPKPTEKQKAAAAALENGPLPASALAEMGLSRAVLDNLCEKGVLRKSQVDKTVDLYADIPRSEEPVVLSDDQQRVFEGLAAQLAQQKPAAALLHGGQDPTPQLTASAALLERMGAQVLIMPCNTAHNYYDAVAGAVHIPVLHMIRLTAQALQARGVAAAGLLATDGTVETGIYQRTFGGTGIDLLTPEPEGQRAIMDMIYQGVKAGDLRYDASAARRAMDSLLRRGARTLILGCTELPLAAKLYQLDYPFTDPTLELALGAIRFAGGETAT